MKKKVLMAIAALSAVAVVCVALLAVFNKLWFVPEEERFKRSVSAIMQADSFDVLFDADNEASNLEGNYLKITAFNTEIGATDSYKIRKVRRAKGGRDDGYYLFQTRGRGFGGGYVEVLIGYTPEGILTGIVKLDVSASNDRAGNINWNTASDQIKGKTCDDEFKGGLDGGNQIIASTGATRTLGGASEAISISNRFFKAYILGTGGTQPTSEVVTDQDTIDKLDELFEISQSDYSGTNIAQYVKYPISTAFEDTCKYKARVNAVYYADKTYVILEVESQAGPKGYGDWTLFVLLNNQTNLVAAISPSVAGYIVGGKFDASALDSAAVLTTLFKNEDKDNLADMGDEGKYLQGTTRVTETNDGLKSAVYHALDKAVFLRTQLLALAAQEE